MSAPQIQVSASAVCPTAGAVCPTIPTTPALPAKPKKPDRHKGKLLRLWCDDATYAAWRGKTTELRALLQFASAAGMTPADMRLLLRELTTAKQFLSTSVDAYNQRAAATVSRYLLRRRK